jgi:hypothetical protein
LHKPVVVQAAERAEQVAERAEQLARSLAARVRTASDKPEP